MISHTIQLLLPDNGISLRPTPTVVVVVMIMLVVHWDEKELTHLAHCFTDYTFNSSSVTELVSSQTVSNYVALLVVGLAECHCGVH